jgi:hypothetical protein
MALAAFYGDWPFTGQRMNANTHNETRFTTGTPARSPHHPLYPTRRTI